MKKSIIYIFFALLSGFAFSQSTITLENQCNCDVLNGTDISSPGSTTPEGATVGDVYVNTDTGVIYFWDGDSWEYTATDVPELQNFTFDSTTNVLSLEIEDGNIVTVDLSIANTDDQTASEVTITDSGDNFTATNVEGALAELATTSTTSGNGDAWGVTGEDITSEINRSGNVIIGGTAQIGTTPVPKLAIQNFDNILTDSNIIPINILQLHRAGRIGSKWDANAQFRLGSYSSHINSTTSLEIALTDLNHSSVYNTVMTMQANGNIGIGTVSPTTKLHVAGDARIETFTAGANTDDIVVADANGVLKTITQSSISTANEPWFGTDNNAEATDNTEDIYVMGNVGIGTSSPTYKLEVSDLSLIQGLRVGRGNRTTNTLVGTNTLIANTTGTDNTAIGYFSLEDNTTGDSNTAIGVRTLVQNISGSANTVIGNRAGDNIISGNRNIVIGANADAPSGTAHDQLNIGNWIYGVDGDIGIGTSAPAQKLDVNGNIAVSGTTVHTSDERLKTNIEGLSKTLDKLLTIRGVSYNWKKETHKTTDKQIGVIAQEVEKEFPELVLQNGEYKSVNYAGFVAPTIEAIRELSDDTTDSQEKIKALETENTELKKQLSLILERIEQLENK